MTDYRKMFAQKLEQMGQTQDPTMQQYEQEIMKQQPGQENRPTLQLIDNLTGSNFAQGMPKQESMKDRLGQLLQLKQGQENQKLNGLGKLASMQGQAEASAAQRDFQQKMFGLKLAKLNGGMGGQQLKPSELLKINEGNAPVSVLQDIKSVLDNSKGIFGPVAGRVASYNPYNTEGKSVDAQLKVAAQTVGLFLEDGKLQAADELKYQSMLPQLTDTPEVAANKLAHVERLVIQKQNSNLSALRQAGYNTASVDRSLVAPALPGLGSRGPSQAPRQQQVAQTFDWDNMDPAELEVRYMQMKQGRQ